jgi:hypothetical protein
MEFLIHLDPICERVPRNNSEIGSEGLSTHADSATEPIWIPAHNTMELLFLRTQYHLYSYSRLLSIYFTFPFVSGALLSHINPFPFPVY